MMNSFSSYLSVLIFFFAGTAFGHITVYNGNVPDTVQNFGPVDLARVVGGGDVAQDGLAPSVGAPSGIIQHNLHVGSQSNYAMGSRRKRFIEQNINRVYKQINISKRNVTDQERNTEKVLNGRVKRYVERVGKINKQVNIDMGNRRKRNIVQNIDYVHTQKNLSW